VEEAESIITHNGVHALDSNTIKERPVNLIDPKDPETPRNNQKDLDPAAWAQSAAHLRQPRAPRPERSNTKESQVTAKPAPSTITVPSRPRSLAKRPLMWAAGGRDAWATWQCNKPAADCRRSVFRPSPQPAAACCPSLAFPAMTRWHVFPPRFQQRATSLALPSLAVIGWSCELSAASG
jgi:hypothetical protein